jgi:hypothetical protein
MVRNGDVPELLETFMEACGEDERWVTVSEFRQYFHLDSVSSPAISGFFSRIYRGSFFSCPYRVERIERFCVKKPHHRTIKRYLIKRRPFLKRKYPESENVRD